jgi:hypothetical protein
MIYWAEQYIPSDKMNEPILCTIKGVIKIEFTKINHLYTSSSPRYSNQSK